MKLSYDGFGINDAEDPYRSRLLTFSTSVPEGRRKQIGRAIEAAPDLLELLEQAVSAAELRLEPHLANKGGSGITDYWLQPAKDVIARIKST